jgi:uncharacterized protein (DUF4415 family)
MNKGSRLKTELTAPAKLADRDIDTSDIPEVLDWSDAKVGRFYRPVKQVVTIRLDANVIAWFKARDKKYQTAVNRALRQYMLSQTSAPKARATRNVAARRKAARG